MATSALARLRKIWKMRKLSMKTKIRLLNSMVKSILMYGCESWTITDKIWKKIEAFEMKCYRRLLGITWKDKTLQQLCLGQDRGKFSRGKMEARTIHTDSGKKKADFLWASSLQRKDNKRSPSRHLWRCESSGKAYNNMARWYKGMDKSQITRSLS